MEKEKQLLYGSKRLGYGKEQNTMKNWLLDIPMLVTYWILANMKDGLAF